jgi:hypothetical protein
MFTNNKLFICAICVPMLGIASLLGVYHALLPAGLLHRKRLAMTCEEHRHCGFSLHVIAVSLSTSLRRRSLKQSRKHRYNKIITYHNYSL